MALELHPADNQPINARFGDAVWLTSFITPDNPDILLKHQQITRNIPEARAQIVALWRYVSRLPYRETIKAKLTAGGRTFSRKDTWFYPAEIMQVRQSNCANRSFLLASLLKNTLPDPNQVYVTFGYLNLQSPGAHAWVTLDNVGDRFIIETTQPNLPNPFIRASEAVAYEDIVYFNQEKVYTVGRVSGQEIAAVLNSEFKIKTIEFLEGYLCEHCLSLEG